MIERTVPILPCRELDDVIPFYEALGFTLTYRQDRPYPCAALQRGAIDLMFGAISGFEPADSYASVIMLAPDTGEVYDTFAAGLRSAYGKVPIAGIPRITRPRRKQGTAAGFTVVDPGGNWLRVTRNDGDENSAGGDAPAGRLERVMLNAARQGDSRGDEQAAIKILEAGLTRHPDATAVERTPVLVYLAELLARTGDVGRARSTLADLRDLDLDRRARVALSAELETAAELERELPAP